MKRWIALLALLLLLGCAYAAAADICGSWYLSILEMQDGAQLDPALLGMDMAITFNEDGSAELHGSEGSAPIGNWTFENSRLTVHAGDEIILDAILKDGRLIAADEALGGSMIFTRENAFAPLYDPGAAHTAPSEDDFFGSWEAVMVETMGMQLPAASIGTELKIELRSGSASVTMVQDAENIISYEAQTALVDGILLIPEVEGNESSMEMPLQLHESGVISFTSEDDGEITIIYFEKRA